MKRKKSLVSFAIIQLVLSDIRIVPFETLFLFGRLGFGSALNVRAMSAFVSLNIFKLSFAIANCIELRAGSASVSGSFSSCHKKPPSFSMENRFSLLLFLLVVRQVNRYKNKFLLSFAISDSVVKIFRTESKISHLASFITFPRRGSV
jgi:hypothetical protein